MAKFNEWEYTAENTAIKVASGATKNPKKITGTRLGAILGVNKWKSAFDAWCEICRVAEEPFEDNKFTLAGKAIEPILLEWCKENVSPYIVTPEEHFGTKRPGYDFFPEDPVFGGMWDALALKSVTGKPIGIIEAKTTGRPQDWQDGVPLSYAVQGLLYAALLGLDRVFFPVAFLTDNDYAHPEKFVCTDKNTFLYELKCSEYEINGASITSLVTAASGWWDTHVLCNVSPVFDEKRDATFLKLLRKAEVKSEPLEALAKEAAILEAKIEAIVAKAGLPALEKQLKGLKDQMKPAMIALFTETDECVAAYGWKVKRTTTTEIDKDGLKADGLWEKYTDTKDSYTMTKEKGV
jgi:predicted phage-related endonuclease